VSGTAIVTGATGAIGGAIARGLAEHGYEVLIVARDEAKGKRAAEAVRSRVPGARARHVLGDVSRRASIADLAKATLGPLRLLVNNAAEAPRRRQETPEGIERQLATNVLGYVWMVEAFAAALEKAAPARVVNVASYWAGDLELDDLEFRRRSYDNDTAYRQSKQCNRMLTVVQSEQLAPRGVTVNVCHPGDVNSVLSNSLGFGGSATPDEGAATPLWLATDAGVASLTGRYFERQREVRDRFVQDRPGIDALHEACQRLSSARK
jgi:NAD(P)-dependent dehydrogenase (short-subunit alcohol dehydrogenase family)